MARLPPRAAKPLGCTCRGGAGVGVGGRDSSVPAQTSLRSTPSWRRPPNTRITCRPCSSCNQSSGGWAVDARRGRLNRHISSHPSTDFETGSGVGPTGRWAGAAAVAVGVSGMPAQLREAEKPGVCKELPGGCRLVELLVISHAAPATIVAPPAPPPAPTCPTAAAPAAVARLAGVVATVQPHAEVVCLRYCRLPSRAWQRHWRGRQRRPAQAVGPSLQLSLLLHWAGHREPPACPPLLAGCSVRIGASTFLLHLGPRQVGEAAVGRKRGGRGGSRAQYSSSKN